MSTYEDDIRRALKAEVEAGRLREVGVASAVFGPLAKVYPAIGSKIDWKRVPGAVERSEEDQSLQSERFVEFFDEIRSRFELPGPVMYVGDRATDFVLGAAIDVMRRVLPELIEIPQHHYFVGPDCAWCICMTMEGDVGFGRSTVSSRH
jgi:hypothetical protein